MVADWASVPGLDFRYAMEASDYFERCLSLLDQFRWLHDIKMTDVLVQKPWENMPEEVCRVWNLMFDDLIGPLSVDQEAAIASLSAVSPTVLQRMRPADTIAGQRFPVLHLDDRTRSPSTS